MNVSEKVIVGNKANFEALKDTTSSFLERVKRIREVFRKDSDLVKSDTKGDLKPLFAWPDQVWNSGWSNDNSWSQATFNKYDPHD